MLGNPEFFTIEECKSAGLWPFTFLSAYAMIPYIKRMRGDDITGVEVGVLKGESSYVLLEECPNIKMLHGVDSYKAHTDYETVRSQEDMDQYKTIAEKNLEPYKDRYELKVMDSHKAAMTFRKDSLDFVLLDADHTYDAIKRDLKDWYPKIKSGGHIFIHDTHVPHVHDAIKSFKDENKIRIPLLRSKNQVSFWVKA